MHSAVLIRYIYDGGALSQGRLVVLFPAREDTVTGREVLRTLLEDGVDFDRFYACVYEAEISTGGWLPVLPDVGASDLAADGQLDTEDFEFPIPEGSDQAADEHTRDGMEKTDCMGASEPQRKQDRQARRIDVKLFRRKVDTREAAQAEQAATPAGKLIGNGFHAIGVIGAKTQANVGTLWRSALQLGAAFIFTVGARYKSQATDTVSAPNHIPLFELDDWAAFVEFAPRGARWVAVEFGGTPLEHFEHPPHAIYLLGSEDSGLPKSILRACHEVVSLSAVNYASYNVAVAGAVVMYDRMVKQRARAGKPPPEVSQEEFVRQQTDS